MAPSSTDPEQEAPGPVSTPEADQSKGTIEMWTTDYHCPNCLYLGDPARPTEGFWACQNLCIRE